MNVHRRGQLRLAALAVAFVIAPITFQSGWAANEVAVAAKPVATGAAADTRLIALEGAANVRSIGGLVGSRGPIPLDSFIRAADLNRLTSADRDALAARGVALSIDLRTEEEALGSPNPLREDPRFRYVRVSLLGREKLDMASLPRSLGEMYVRSLSDNQPQFREVFSIMARQDQGAVVFHCTAGKDRTGMVAALLLSLAGVPRGEIVSNYAESERWLAGTTKLTPQMQEMLRQNPQIAALAGSPPEAMRSFLDSLETEHGGARAYLRTIGLNDLEIERLLRRLGQAPPK